MRDTHAHLTWRLNFGIARGLAALELALLTESCFKSAISIQNPLESAPTL